MNDRKWPAEESEGRYDFLRHVTAMMPDLVTVIELAQRRIVYSNCDTLAWTDAQDFAAMTFDQRVEIFHPDDLPAVHAFNERFPASADREEHKIECRLKNRSGEWTLLAVRGRVFSRDAAGNVAQVFLTGQDITANRKAEQDIVYLKEELAKKATDKYLTLFNSIDQGFCILEVLFDAKGRGADYRFLEVNPAFEQQTGLHNVTGKRMRELEPAHEESWYRVYGEVAATGVPKSFEHYASQLGEGVWYEVSASSIDAPELNRVAVLFNDISGRKAQERRQGYLLKLSDALRSSAGPEEMQEKAAALLGRQLDVARAFYFTVERDGEAYVYGAANDYYRPGLKSLAGHSLQAAFVQRALEKMPEGETLVVPDVKKLPDMTVDGMDFYRDMGIESFVAVPLVKKGEFIAGFMVGDHVPRNWTTNEVQLVDETAERTCAEVGRAKAEKALRENETHLATMFDVLPVGIAMIGKDRRIILANKEMRRFLPTSILPSKDEERRWRWQAFHEDGSRVGPAQFPGERALNGEVVVPGLEMLYIDDEGNEVWTRVAAAPIRDEEGNVVQAVSVITDISDIKRSSEALRRSEERLRALNLELEKRVEARTQELIGIQLKQEKEKLNAVIFAQEQERTRIGEGLHNSVAQLLYAVQNRLQLVSSGKSDDENLKVSVQLLMDAIRETRRISFEMMPPVLKDFGLVAALDTLAQRIFPSTFDVKLKVGLQSRLNEDIEVSIYRVVQEAMNNIVKHSGATNASIDISQSEGMVRARIKDNGKGFSKDALKQQGGIGLEIMKNRVRLLEGKIKFQSAAGKGTTVDIQIPVSN